MIGLRQKRFDLYFCLVVSVFILLVSIPAIAEGKSPKKPVWLVVGDSISEHNLSADHNYDEYVSKMLDLDVVNVAVGGTGYLKDYKDKGPWITYMQEWPEDVDLITIMGGLNDSGFELGEFNDDNIDTLYGALKEFYEDLIEIYPCTPIGVITSTPRANSWGENGPDVAVIDAVLQVAHNYSLPTLDLYRYSGLRPWNDDNNKEFFSSSGNPKGDGVHLNDNGQKLIAVKIAAFIEDYLLEE